MQYRIPVASGKGGVGKTLLSANLGISLAQQNKTVILVDLDLGGSNLHTVLGIRNRHEGIGHFINRKVDTLEQLVVPTKQERLFFISGDGLFSGTANLPYWRKLAILKELETLTADFVIMDLGSGTTFNTLDFFLTTTAGLVVTTPDTTAILNAYSFLKAGMFRLLHRTFPGKSAERQCVLDFMQEKVEGGDRTLQTLVSQIADIDPASGQAAQGALETFRPRVVMNMGRTAGDIQLGGRLRQVVRNNLQTDVEFIAYFPYDELASRSALERSPTLLTYPQSHFARAVQQCAARLIHEPVPDAPRLFPDDEDLKELAEDFTPARRRPMES
jgi:flagellar biosynthesis protein FlhG